MATLVSMATLLAFDTSTESMAVALQSPRGVSVWNGEGGAHASAALLPQIRALLLEHALSVAELDAIAFGVGPGAFTGLRTACSVAQGLAFGAGRPVLPIDSLLIVAEDARSRQSADAALDVGVAMDARMSELYAARYRWTDGLWQVTCAPMLCDPDVLASLWGGSVPAIVAGTGVHLLPATLREATTVTLGRTANRARALLTLAQQRYGDGAAVDAALALPLYLRDKVALTTAERAAAALAKALI